MQAEARRFSFLEDQEYQRKKDERAAAKKGSSKYNPGWKDYLLFAYFCTNVAVIGNPLLNTNAVLRSWKNSELFRTENANQMFMDWTNFQSGLAKTALLLFQSAAAGSGMMSGVLVDTFSPSMCLLVAHFLFAGGSYFLKSRATRHLFMGAVLQGAAGELLLNSVLPICGLFGDRQFTMLFILTFCSDLSVLTYPILLEYIAPDTPITQVHDEFYRDWHSTMVWYAWVAGAIGTFVLPVDDDGNLVPVSAASTTPRINVMPKEVEWMCPQTPYIKKNDDAVKTYKDIENGEEEADVTSMSDVELEENEELRKLLPSRGKYGRRKPVSLWGLRFTKKLRTVQFMIACGIFASCTLRSSFYLNNNSSLLETAGDVGYLSTGFMWIMASAAVFGPLFWQVNDTWPVISSLSLLCFLHLAVNVLVAVNALPLQWLTMVVAVAARSATAPTMLTFLANCFGLKHFPAMTIVVGLLGAFFNFCNIFIDQWADTHHAGNYMIGNTIMIGVGLLTFVFVFLQWLNPTISDDGSREEKQEELRRGLDEIRVLIN